jgi:hypothetical protein
MPSSGMLVCVTFVRTGVSQEHIASIIRVTKIGEIGTTLAVTSNRSTVQRNIMWANPRRRHSSSLMLQFIKRTFMIVHHYPS